MSGTGMEQWNSNKSKFVVIQKQGGLTGENLYLEANAAFAVAQEMVRDGDQPISVSLDTLTGKTCGNTADVTNVEGSDSEDKGSDEFEILRPITEEEAAKIVKLTAIDLTPLYSTQASAASSPTPEGETAQTDLLDEMFTQDSGK